MGFCLVIGRDNSLSLTGRQDSALGGAGVPLWLALDRPQTSWLTEIASDHLADGPRLKRMRIVPLCWPVTDGQVVASPLIA